jgi:hypothetical protein
MKNVGIQDDCFEKKSVKQKKNVFFQTCEGWFKKVGGGIWPPQAPPDEAQKTRKDQGGVIFKKKLFYCFVARQESA